VSESSRRAVVSTIGRDRPGIINELSELAAELDLNIDDSRMTRLGEEFAVLMSLTGAEERLRAFEARLQGRSLLAHAGSGYKEMSLSAELSLRAGEGGGGLSFSLMPSWGAPGSMAPGGAGFVAGGGALWSGERMKALAPRGGRENLRQLRWSGQAAWGIPLNTGYSEIFGRPLLLRLVARRQRNGLEDELLVGLELTGAEAR